MEIVRYICEFFFTNFWHWLGLVFALDSIFGGISAMSCYIGTKARKEKEVEDE